MDDRLIKIIIARLFRWFKNVKFTSTLAKALRLQLPSFVMKCFLRSLNEAYSSVELRDKKKLLVGRTPSTKIKNKKCSRNQLELTANFNRKIVEIKQIGPNESALNEKVIGIGFAVEATHGQILDVIVDEDIKYSIEFEQTSEKKRESDEIEKKPVKIPKMFLPGEFRKNSLQPRGIWKEVDDEKVLVYISDDSMINSNKKCVAAFDMDGTIITTKSGRVFPRDENDWKFLYSSTILKLQNFFNENSDFKFVIFTNQAGIAYGSTDVTPFKRKIESIVRQIGISTLVFIGTGKNQFRKPMTGGWDLFVDEYNGGFEPNKEKSFFCGDAAGRKKDHSKADRLFALNIQIPFKTPEEFFMGQHPQDFTMPLFNPKILIEKMKSNDSNFTNDHITFNKKQEMIVLVGYPASGKSSFVWNFLIPKSYVHVNRDTLKTQSKCLTAAEKALRDGSSVVIDNTNPEKKHRKDYVALANKHQVPVRCFRMKVEHAHALHNNKFRQFSNDPHDPVPDVAFNTYKSNYQEPSADEGFYEIVLVNFIPMFENEKAKELYGKFLLEK